MSSAAGGYFIIGEKTASRDDSTNCRTEVMALSGKGELLSRQTFDYRTGRVGVQTDDGGMLLVGCARPSGTMEPHIAKLHSSGTVLWEKIYSVPTLHSFWPEAIARTAEGGCVVVGNNAWYDSLTIALLEFDAQGLIAAELHPDRDQLRMHVDKILIAANGDYVLSGVNERGIGCVARLDPEGHPLWTKDYDGRLVPDRFVPDRAPSGLYPVYHAQFLAAATPDGGLVLGYAPWNGTDYAVPKLVRTDAEGGILWTVDNIETAHVLGLARTSWTMDDLLVDSQGQIVIAGTHIKTDFVFIPGFPWLSEGNGYIMQFDALGRLNWNTSLQASSANQEVSSVVQTNSGDYAVLAEFENDKAQLIRVRRNGRIR